MFSHLNGTKVPFQTGVCCIHTLLVATLPAPVFDIDRTQFNKGAEVQVGVIATNGLSSLIVTARDETFESRPDGLAELGA